MTQHWLAGARRIAVVRPEELGDVILTVPMFPVLRHVAPQAELHFICLPYTAPVARCVAEIDQVLTLSTRHAANELEAHFRRARYDAVFFPQSRSSHAWAAFRAGVRHRVGTRGRLFSVLYNHRAPRRREVPGHETAYDLSLITAVLGRTFPPTLVAPRLPPDAIAGLEAKLSAAGLGGAGSVIVVHPGSGNAERWPGERFAAVAARLARDHGLQVAVTGSSAEAPLVNAVVDACPGARPLAGVLTMEELMVLLARAALVLSNSTGPTHLASAFDTPVVGILPPRDMLRWRLTNRRGATLSPPHGTPDLDLVPVDDVLAEARRVLKMPPGKVAGMAHR